MQIHLVNLPPESFSAGYNVTKPIRVLEEREVGVWAGMFFFNSFVILFVCFSVCFCILLGHCNFPFVE